MVSEYRNILSAVASDVIDFRMKARLIAIFMTTPQIMFDELTIAAIMLLSGLFGINLALNYYVLRMAGTVNYASGSLFGLAIGVLGVGCAACGSFILASFLSVSATAAVISFLPLRGKELLLTGIVVMLIATYRTLKSIARPVCPVQI